MTTAASDILIGVGNFSTSLTPLGRSATYRLKQSEQRNTGLSYFVALIKGWPVK